MTYKTLHEKYGTGKTTIVPFCRGLAKGELPGSEIHKSPLGDFICDYVSHLTLPDEVKHSSKDWHETAELMRCLLSANIRFNQDGSAVVRWIGPERPSLCE